jgi:hypothetical protein
LPGGTEESHEKLQPGLLVSKLRFKYKAGVLTIKSMFYVISLEFLLRDPDILITGTQNKCV